MTAAELIAELSKVPPDTVITVWAGYGQSIMKASASGIRNIPNDQMTKYIMEETDEEGYDTTNVFEIAAQ